MTHPCLFPTRVCCRLRRCLCHPLRRRRRRCRLRHRRRRRRCRRRVSFT